MLNNKSQILSLAYQNCHNEVEVEHRIENLKFLDYEVEDA